MAPLGLAPLWARRALEPPQAWAGEPVQAAELAWAVAQGPVMAQVQAVPGAQVQVPGPGPAFVAQALA